MAGNSKRTYESHKPGGGGHIYVADARDEVDAFYAARRINNRVRREKRELAEAEKRKAITLPSLETLKRFMESK